ncbi:hypothetical protein EBR66_02895 [bacterium]|nr:hypothetical protein [bacterium]
MVERARKRTTLIQLGPGQKLVVKEPPPGEKGTVYVEPPESGEATELKVWGTNSRGTDRFDS